MTTILNPERFDPAAAPAGSLIDIEHLLRYEWAATMAEGRDVLDAACGVGYGSRLLAAAGASSVTGVDLDPEAISLASRNAPDGVTFIASDVRTLPFGDQRFDLVVSFETIEHIEQAEAAIDEFRRVLRPGGLLIVSSPNRGVYAGGNEHHVHEFTPPELREVLRARFANVRRYAQHAWLASSLESDRQQTPVLKRRVEPAPDREIYTIAIAGDGELPEPPCELMLGAPQEIGWWMDQVEEHRLLAIDAERRVEVAHENEQLMAERLARANARVLQIEQELAKVPALTERVHELEDSLSELEARHAQTLAAVRAGYENSVVWRAAAPLRGLKRRARRG